MQSDEMNIQENTMFDMRKCGAILSALRRKANLTQAQLAEKLGISYQAVSSWERGASMPDIGKLVDLARTLDTTVDYILSGEEAAQAPLPQPVAEAETSQTLQVHVVSKLNPKKNASHSLTALLSLAPFLDQATLDQTALESQDAGDPAMLCGLAPFVSKHVLEQLADRCEPTADMALISGLAPFLSQEALGRLFARCREAAAQEAAAKPAARISADTIAALIDRTDSDDILQLAQRLRDQLTDDHIAQLIDCCDSEEIPALAGILGDKLTDSHLTQLVDCCDSDCLLALVETLSVYLSPDRAAAILKRM